MQYYEQREKLGVTFSIILIPQGLMDDGCLLIGFNVCARSFSLTRIVILGLRIFKLSFFKFTFLRSTPSQLIF